MKYRIVYQDTPYHFTTPGVVVIEAQSQGEALVAAVDHLTLHGRAVYLPCCLQQDLGISKEDAETVFAAFNEKEFKGSTRLRSISVYKPEVRGRVLEVCP